VEDRSWAVALSGLRRLAAACGGGYTTRWREGVPPVRPSTRRRWGGLP